MKNRICIILSLLVITCLLTTTLYASTIVKLKHVYDYETTIPSTSEILYTAALLTKNGVYTYLLIQNSSGLYLSILNPNGTETTIRILTGYQLSIYNIKPKLNLCTSLGTIGNTRIFTLCVGEYLYVIANSTLLKTSSKSTVYSVLLADIDNDNVPEILVGTAGYIIVYKYRNGKLKESKYITNDGNINFLMTYAYMNKKLIAGFSCKYGMRERAYVCNIALLEISNGFRLTTGKFKYMIHSISISSPHAKLYYIVTAHGKYLLTIRCSSHADLLKNCTFYLLDSEGKPIREYSIILEDTLYYSDWSVLSQHGSSYEYKYVVLTNRSSLVVVNPVNATYVRVIRTSFTIVGTAERGLVCSQGVCAAVLEDSNKRIYVLLLNGTLLAVLNVEPSYVATFGPFLIIVNKISNRYFVHVYELEVSTPVTRHVIRGALTRHVVKPAKPGPGTAPVPIIRLVAVGKLTGLFIRHIGALTYLSYAADVYYGIPVGIVLKSKDDVVQISIPKGSIPEVEGHPTYIRSIEVVPVENVSTVNARLLSNAYYIATVPRQVVFSKPINITFRVTKIVRNMYILYYNESIHKWVPLPTLIRSYSPPTVSAKVKWSGIYSVGIWYPENITTTIDVKYNDTVLACNPAVINVKVLHDNKPVKGVIVRVYFDGIYRAFCITNEAGECSISLKTCAIGVHYVTVRAGLGHRELVLYVYPKIEHTQMLGSSWVTW